VAISIAGDGDQEQRQVAGEVRQKPDDEEKDGE
jgi:hypothetical protein